MNNIPSFYQYLTEIKDNNKIYFILNNNNIETVTSDNALDLNKKLDNYILHNFFENIIVIQDLSFDEIEKLNFPENSIIYSFKPKGVYKPVDNDERKKVHKIYDKLYSLKNIDVYMNTNITSSKIETQKMFDGEYYFPKAVYKKEDIKSKIGFPVVAKPESGHSGEGIQKFNSEKEMNDFYKENPDIIHNIYCEFIDYEREYRALFCHDEIFYLGERIPKIEKNIDINNKKADEQMAFVYAAQNISKWPYLKELININKSVYKKIKLGVYSIDFFLTKDKKIKLIELNSQTGVDPYRLLNLYEHLYIKHFNSKLPSNKLILKKELINLFLENEYKHFSKEINSSLNPIDYKNVKINKELLKEVDKFSEFKII